MNCVGTSCQDASVGFDRLSVGLVDLNGPGSLIHVERERQDGTVTIRVHCSRGGRDVIDSFITLAAVDVGCREMCSSDLGQFASGRNFSDK
eukprot:2754489-Heterocapsa_arctica.AAC.1